MVLSHLVALTKIVSDQVLGPFIVSAPSPWLDSEVPTQAAEEMYRAMGWSLPVRHGRILDSRDTWQSLSLEPRWDFLGLLKSFQSGTDLELIRDGCY